MWVKALRRCLAYGKTQTDLGEGQAGSKAEAGRRQKAQVEVISRRGTRGLPQTLQKGALSGPTGVPVSKPRLRPPPTPIPLAVPLSHRRSVDRHAGPWAGTRHLSDRTDPLNFTAAKVQGRSRIDPSSAGSRKRSRAGRRCRANRARRKPRKKTRWTGAGGLGSRCRSAVCRAFLR